jgi:hypothetical protein
MREEHWVVADLQGKARHIRTIPIPNWIKAAIDQWAYASGITEGCLFRAINKAGKIWAQECVSLLPCPSHLDSQP